MLKELWQDVVHFFNENVWNVILFFSVLILGSLDVKITTNIC